MSAVKPESPLSEACGEASWFDRGRLMKSNDTSALTYRGTSFEDNLVLDELDRELERRGLRFVRYADDSNIYVRSERAGQRVMQSVRGYITRKLKLKVNETNSAVARPQQRKFLGFSFTDGPNIRRRIAP